MFQAAPKEAIESAVKMHPTPLHLATRSSWTGLLDTITNTKRSQAAWRFWAAFRQMHRCVSMALPNQGVLDSQVRRP